MRDLFQSVDDTLAEDISLSELARRLSRAGVPTATGNVLWGRTQIKNLLRNPKYAGLGRNKRWVAEWTEELGDDGRKRMHRHVHDRMEDEAAWAADTYEAVGIPAIVTPEQWHRVQAKLKAVAKLANRSPRRADEEATSTLLDGGFVFCADCGDKLSNSYSKNRDHKLYACEKGRGTPNRPHKKQIIQAKATDALALRLLAQALTDPEQVLALADAAEEQAGEADTERQLAESLLRATNQQIAEITTEQETILASVESLRKLPEHGVRRGRPARQAGRA